MQEQEEKKEFVFCFRFVASLSPDEDIYKSALLRNRSTLFDKIGLVWTESHFAFVSFVRKNAVCHHTDRNFLLFFCRIHIERAAVHYPSVDSFGRLGARLDS